MKEPKPSVLLLYHFFHPDDVVSARQYTRLAAFLAESGWDVTVLTSNRYCRDPHGRMDVGEEMWNGVRIIRVARPGWNQANPLLRLGNAAVMLTRWAARARALPPQDVIVLGTDPQFAALILPALRRAHPKAVLTHWCFDLYPEAIMADRPGSILGGLAGALRPAMRRGYRQLDWMVDIGPCMRRRLATYRHGAACATIVPSALYEPETPSAPDPETRRALFGEADLALLYSGTLGKAHAFEPFLDLARAVYPHNPRIQFCFACCGQREAELRAAVTSADRNVHLAGFCDENDLAHRLAAADIHLVSLRSGWDGLVVPSKVFGSLAMGKPVLYAGPEGSDIATWIDQYDVGMNLNDGSVDAATALLNMAADRSALQQWQANALQTYHAHFSMPQTMSQWHQLLGNAMKG